MKYLNGRELKLLFIQEKWIKQFLLLSLLITIGISHAQDKGILRGFVSDSLSGEPLPYANIYIKNINRGIAADSRGYFLMATLPALKLILTISCIGYETKNTEIEIDQEKVTSVKILLMPAKIQMRTIETSGGIANKNANDLGLHRIAIHDIENLPKGFELDVLRSLQHLPGVQTTGDVSSRFYVRGGSSNENLIMLDNTVIYNPFHAAGILSSVDSDIINSVEFYKSGFPVEYSNRLSSVINISSKDGNKNSLGAKAGLSLLTGKLLIEGPFANGSFLINGRINYTDAILKKFRNNNSLPTSFYDFYTKINYSDDEFMNGAKFSISTYSSNDKILFDDPTRVDYTWNNSFFSFNYFQITDSPLFYHLNMSYSKFFGEQIPNESASKLMSNEIRDITANFDFNYVFDSNDSFIGGLKISELQTNLSLKNYIGLKNSEDSKGTSLSAYLKYNLLRFSLFAFDLGSRIHATRLAGGGPSFFVEPRAGFTIHFLPELLLKGSWGIYMQDLVTVSDENEVVTIFEPWIITPLYLTPSNAIQYNAGIKFTPAQNFSINVEGYYKIMHDVTILNSYRDLFNQKYFLPASGKSYGLEIIINHNFMNLNLTTSYAWMYTSKEYNGYSFKPRYDSPHNVNIILEAALGNGWNVSCIWKYASGTPFTNITGYYDRLTIDILSDTQFLVDSYKPFMMLGSTNLGRLPDYHRLDLSISKKFTINNMKLYFDVSILNVYDRKNLFYFKRETGERVNMLPFLPTVNLKVEL